MKVLIPLLVSLVLTTVQMLHNNGVRFKPENNEYYQEFYKENNLYPMMVGLELPKKTPLVFQCL